MNRRLAGSCQQRMTPEKAQNSLPKVGHDRQNGAELNHHREHLPVTAFEVLTDQFLGDSQVSGRTHRQKLRQSFDDPKQDCGHIVVQLSVSFDSRKLGMENSFIEFFIVDGAWQKAHPVQLALLENQALHENSVPQNVILPLPAQNSRVGLNKPANATCSPIGTASRWNRSFGLSRINSFTAELPKPFWVDCWPRSGTELSGSQAADSTQGRQVAGHGLFQIEGRNHPGNCPCCPRRSRAGSSDRRIDVGRGTDRAACVAEGHRSVDGANDAHLYPGKIGYHAHR